MKYAVGALLFCVLACASYAKIADFMTGLSAKQTNFADTMRCPNSHLQSIVLNAMSDHPTNSDAMAQEISSRVKSTYGGPWVSVAVQLKYSPQWTYYGSNSAFSSGEYCLVVQNGWFVQVNKVDVNGY